MENLLEKRKLYLLDYKLNNNKESLYFLVNTFKDVIESIISKYKDIEYEELLSVCNVAIIHCINNFNTENDIHNLLIYVHKYIKRYINNFYIENSISYNVYSSQHKNGEETTYYDMDFVISKALVNEMLISLEKTRPEYVEVLKLRYGLSGDLPMTLDEIAEIQQISLQAVQKREEKALMILRNKFKNHI